MAKIDFYNGSTSSYAGVDFDPSGKKTELNRQAQQGGVLALTRNNFAKTLNWFAMSKPAEPHAEAA